MKIHVDLVRAACLALPHVTETVQWGDDLVFKVHGKMFVVAGVPAEERGISLKVGDEAFFELQERPGFRPAPYLARAKWLAVDASNDLTPTELKALIADAYRIVFAGLPKKLREPKVETTPAPTKARTRRTI